MNQQRVLLALRTIDVSYRSAIRHAPADGDARYEWLSGARQRAERILNSLESQLLAEGPLPPQIRLELRIVRENVRRSNAASQTPPGDRSNEAAS